jgi:hypothetical protein
LKTLDGLRRLVERVKGPEAAELLPKCGRPPISATITSFALAFCVMEADLARNLHGVLGL